MHACHVALHAVEEGVEVDRHDACGGDGMQQVVALLHRHRHTQGTSSHACGQGTADYTDKPCALKEKRAAMGNVRHPSSSSARRSPSPTRPQQPHPRKTPAHTSARTQHNKHRHSFKAHDKGQAMCARGPSLLVWLAYRAHGVVEVLAEGLGAGRGGARPVPVQHVVLAMSITLPST